MLRKHGQQLQPTDVAVIIDTASKVNALFMISVSSRQQSGNYCLGSLHRTSDSDMMSYRYVQRRGVDLALLRSQQARRKVAGTVFRGRIDIFGCSHRAVERRVKELYITARDVQMQLMIFSNIRLAPAVKTWYTFRESPNRSCRWIEVPLRGGRAGSFQMDCRTHNDENGFSIAR